MPESTSYDAYCLGDYVPTEFYSNAEFIGHLLLSFYVNSTHLETINC